MTRPWIGDAAGTPEARLHGAVSLPKTEKVARNLHTQITKRLATLAATAKELSGSRTGDEKKAMELARLIEFWMVHGKPHREPPHEI